MKSKAALLHEGKDLGLKVGSPDMVLWDRVVKGTKARLKDYAEAMKVDSKLLAVAEEEYSKAEKAFKEQ